MQPAGPAGPLVPESPSAVRGGVPEVETEYEDDAGEGDLEDEEEGQGELQEVEEEDITACGELSPRESDSASVASGAGRGAPGDYAVPEANKEVWKQFGCDTEAGRMLKRLYGSGLTSAASSRIAYPAVRKGEKWTPQTGPRGPCPQRAQVRVPNPIRRHRPDPDDPANWRVPLPGRRPAQEIIAAMEADVIEKPNLPRGRCADAEKDRLQERFRYCGGRMMPQAAMGHVPAGDLPQRAARKESDRPGYVDPETNMTREQQEIFQELTEAIRWKQQRIAEIDAENAADGKASKARTERNKEALRLNNEIAENMRNIDTLIKITDA